MIWPYVHRETMREALAGKDEIIGLLRERLAEVQSELHQLRTPTQSVVAVAPIVFTESEDDKRIRKAINENAAIGGKIDPRLQSHLRGYAAELRRGGASTDEIEAKLGTWVTSEPQEMAG
jgi:hypothetical protein